MWKLNKVLLNNQWTKEEITKEIREYFEVNEIQNMSKLWMQLNQCLEETL